MNHGILQDHVARLRRCGAALGLAAIAAGASATTLTVTDTAGRPLATAKVREIAAAPRKLDTSDHGYPAPGKVNIVDVDIPIVSCALGGWPQVQFLVSKQQRMPQRVFQSLAVRRRARIACVSDRNHRSRPG